MRQWQTDWAGSIPLVAERIRTLISQLNRNWGFDTIYFVMHP